MVARLNADKVLSDFLKWHSRAGTGVLTITVSFEESPDLIDGILHVSHRGFDGGIQVGIQGEKYISGTCPRKERVTIETMPGIIIPIFIHSLPCC